MVQYMMPHSTLSMLWNQQALHTYRILAIGEAKFDLVKVSRQRSNETYHKRCLPTAGSCTNTVFKASNHSLTCTIRPCAPIHQDPVKLLHAKAVHSIYILLKLLPAALLPIPALQDMIS